MKQPGHRALRVLVTRTEPAASLTAKKLEQNGFNPIVWPLFEVRDTGEPFDASRADGVILTSANAAAILKARGWNARRPGLVAFCVGAKTANAAQSLGFNKIVTGDGDAGKLTGSICNERQDLPTNLIYPAGIDKAFDMEAAFAGSRIEVKTANVYSVEPVFPKKGETRAILEQLGTGIVLGYSEKTLNHVASIIASVQPPSAFRHLTLVAISSKVADSVLRYPWAHAYAASIPNERSMIEILSRITLRKEI